MHCIASHTGSELYTKLIRNPLIGILDILTAFHDCKPPISVLFGLCVGVDTYSVGIYSVDTYGVGTYSVGTYGVGTYCIDTHYK